MTMLSVLLGPAFIAGAFALTALRVEPFANFFYLCAWYGLIITLDQLIRRREGRSLATRCGLAGFVLLLIWSAATWYFFELLNLRLDNWYYVFVIDRPRLRAAGTLLSFATVLPGIFWIDHYLELQGMARHHSGPRVRVSAGGLRGLQATGLLCLALPLLWPSWFFPLVWVALLLLLAPVEYRQRGDSLLRQLERGEYGPLWRALLAGLIAGILWESLNFWARAKWIYTVPFFDRLKLFEMPVAGFLGFPPFAVECMVLYRVLVARGLAPGFGRFADAVPAAGGARRVPALIGALLAVAFSLAVDQLVVGPVVITSVTPAVAGVEDLDPESRAALDRLDIRYLTDLEGWGSDRLWDHLQSDLGAARVGSLRRLVSLYLHQGIGVRYGNQLRRAGIGSVEELGELAPADVRARMLQAGAADPPSLRRIGVWVRRAGGAAP